jgi:hypothetical protein
VHFSIFQKEKKEKKERRRKKWQQFNLHIMAEHSGHRGDLLKQEITEDSGLMPHQHLAERLFRGQII